MPADQSAAHAGASKLAQLLGEVLIHHAPWTSQVAEETRRRVTGEWLDKLEEHSTGFIAPLVDRILAETDPPEEIKNLLEHVARPTAELGSFAQQFFVYGVLFNLASSVLAPFSQAMANAAWAAVEDRPLSAADLATMVVRGLDFGQIQVPLEGGGAASDIKAKTGVAPGQKTSISARISEEVGYTGVNVDRFNSLIGVTGMAPDMTTLFEMVRRGIISEADLAAGIKQGDIKDEWAPYVSMMRYVTVSPDELVAAALRGIDPEHPASVGVGISGGGGTGPGSASYENAKKWAHAVGLEPDDWIGNNPDWFDMKFSTAGRPPGPVELAHAALRGFIPWNGTGAAETTFEQGIAESDVKSKWTPILRKLSEYYPPPGEVRSLLMHGGITTEQAEALWQADGISPEIAKAYAHLAEVEQITQDKALAKGDILTLVQEQLLDDQEATTALAQIGYTGANAATLVKLAHWRYNYEALRASVRTVGRYYETWKIDATGATKALVALGLGHDQATNLVKQLTVQRDATSPLPTSSAIASAFNYGVIHQDVAQSMLQDLGYSPWNAWLILSTRKHGPLPGEPTEGAPPRQPDERQIQVSAYNTAVAAADSQYQSAVTLAKQEYLELKPPQTANYDSAVKLAASERDAAIQAAAKQNPQGVPQ